MAVRSGYLGEKGVIATTSKYDRFYSLLDFSSYIKNEKRQKEYNE